MHQEYLQHAILPRIRTDLHAHTNISAAVGFRRNALMSEPPPAVSAISDRTAPPTEHRHFKFIVNTVLYQLFEQNTAEETKTSKLCTTVFDAYFGEYNLLKAICTQTQTHGMGVEVQKDIWNEIRYGFNRATVQTQMFNQ